MTRRQIELVQTSFAEVKPIAQAAAALFYDRLFEIAPEVRPMFRGDMAEQGRKLMTALAFVVAGLERFEQLRGVVAELGARHASYGVRDYHYTAVAEALLWTLAAGLGRSFTPEVEDAWVSAYTILADAMRKGVAAAAAA